MTNDMTLYFNVTVSRESVRVNFRFRFKTEEFIFSCETVVPEIKLFSTTMRSYNEM